MTMERAGSTDRTSTNYQCTDCNYVVRVPTPKPGDRHSMNFACPRCAVLGKPQPRTTAPADAGYTGE